jgi:hypothetical protein
MDKVLLLSRATEPTDALAFVKALIEVSTLDGSEAMSAMYDLFDTRAKLAEPLRVPVKPGADVAGFVHACEGHGIVAVVQDAWL